MLAAFFDACFDRLHVPRGMRAAIVLLASLAAACLGLLLACAGLLILDDARQNQPQENAAAIAGKQKAVPPDVVADVERILLDTKLPESERKSPPAPALSHYAQELLLAAAASDGGEIDSSSGGSRGSLRANGRAFIDSTTPVREAAQWRAALDELYARGLIGDATMSLSTSGNSHIYWRVTAAGFAVADRLKSH